MTVSNLIAILEDYERTYGEDTFVVLADGEDIIGDADTVGITDNNEIVISIL